VSEIIIFLNEPLLILNTIYFCRIRHCIHPSLVTGFDFPFEAFTEIAVIPTADFSRRISSS
jgi:hypothetical protein